MVKGHRHGNDGRLAEAVARAWLRCKGWRILAVRAATPLGELDIVARRGRWVAFVEVKQRRRMEQARRALGLRQKQRIVRAAMYWLGRHPHLARADIRFDLITVNALLVLRHHAHAFSAGEVLRSDWVPL